MHILCEMEVADRLEGLSNAAYPVIVLYSKQRGTRMVPLEQRAMKIFCRLNSKTYLQS